MTRTNSSKQICYTCGYANHSAETAIRKKRANRNQQIPYQTASKNDWSHASIRMHQHKKHKRHNGLTACISLEGDPVSYVTLTFSVNQQKKALIDTGACAFAISEKDYQELKSFGTQRSPPIEVSEVNIASGQLIPVRGQIEPTFLIANHSFTEKFLVLPSTNSFILVNHFSKTIQLSFTPRKT